MAATLSPIASFARIKPIDACKDGGTAATIGITAFDAAEGTIEIGGVGSAEAKSGGSGGSKSYDHFAAIIPPTSTQAETYNTICAPLVAKWLAGFDADIIMYGQTGSGKTYTAFGPPHAMARAASALGADGGRGTVSADGVMRDEYGFILRAGFEALAAVAAINSGGGGGGDRAVLHGTMVEMSIMSWQNQAVFDLLDASKPCYVDKEHHLQGARYVPLRCARDLVRMAAAVEARITRGSSLRTTGLWGARSRWSWCMRCSRWIGTFLSTSWRAGSTGLPPSSSAVRLMVSSSHLRGARPRRTG